MRILKTAAPGWPARSGLGRLFWTVNLPEKTRNKPLSLPPPTPPLLPTFRFLCCATGTAAGSFQADVCSGGAVQDQQGGAGADPGGGPPHHAHLVQPQLAGASRFGVAVMFMLMVVHTNQVFRLFSFFFSCFVEASCVLFGGCSGRIEASVQGVVVADVSTENSQGETKEIISSPIGAVRHL